MRHRLVFAVVTALVVAGAAGAKEDTFDSDGVKIRYLTEGKGETVVLVHGFAASAEFNWVAPRVVADLAKEYRVVALDNRGHGKSGKPHDPKKYGAEMAEDVVRLLDHLKVKKAHVVGYSMGSAIAGKLLVSHPDRLLSVTFGGGSPAFALSKEELTFRGALADSLEKGKGIGVLISALTPPGKPKTSEEAAATMSDFILRGQDQKALAAAVRGWKGLVVTEAQLKATKVPVCFVYGNREAKLIEGRIEQARKLFPRAQATAIEGGDHIGTIARAEFRKAILDFLRDQKK